MNCPLCQSAMPTHNPTRRRPHPHRASYDHIMPKARGGSFMLPDGTHNRRIMCQACNHGIAESVHCIAAWMCALAVARDLGVKPPAVQREWGFPAMLEAERGRFKSSRQIDAESRQEALQRLSLEFRPVTIAEIWQ